MKWPFLPSTVLTVSGSRGLWVIEDSPRLSAAERLPRKLLRLSTLNEILKPFFRHSKPAKQSTQLNPRSSGLLLSFGRDQPSTKANELNERIDFNRV